jgi:hypothetical protein
MTSRVAARLACTPPNFVDPKSCACITPKRDKPPKGGPCKKGGSIIGCETRTLAEVINVTGTAFSLHYQSDRASGRRGLGLGGWSLSVHHTYDVRGRTLYLGNGDQRSATAADGRTWPIPPTS